MEEIFEIVNEKNQVIETAPRSEVHAKGLIHRAVNVFLVNSQKKIFLQKRSETKDMGPGLWDMSAGEHLKPGETFKQAAKQGLEEELGITAIALKELRGPKRFRVKDKKGIINEFDALFLVESSQIPELNPEEVAEGGFFSIEEVEKEIKKGKKRFTAFFLLEWPEVKAWLSNSMTRRGL